MGNEFTQKVYDALGETYYSSKHRTISYFNAIQTFPLRTAFSEQAIALNRALEELDVLNIGVGNGQHCEQLCLPIFEKAFGERVRWDRITDFDISSVMLAAAKRYYPSIDVQKQTGETEPIQVQGDVLDISDILSAENFDIVLAGLCDHVEDQERMYQEVFKILRPRGVFIVTYPHKDLMTTIRREIYGINPNTTRFQINDRKYLLPSHITEPEDVKELFKNTGFEMVQSINLYHDSNFNFHNQSLSNTVRQAQTIIHQRLEDIPILVLGVGRKPDGLTDLERKILRDPWFWYN